VFAAAISKTNLYPASDSFPVPAVCRLENRKLVPVFMQKSEEKERTFATLNLKIFLTERQI
jgi:hypothetical protein